MSSTAYHFRQHHGQPGGPLLFLFHGTGGDENQFFDLGRELLPEASLVAPRGDVSEHGALRYFRRTGEGVFDMPDLSARTEQMAGFIKAHRDALQPSITVGLGYSNGANILASVLLSRPDLFDGAMLLHPLIPWAPDDVAGLEGRKVLITAGRRDPICPPHLTQALSDFLERQGARTTLAWHEGGHELRGEEMQAISRFIREVAA